MANDSRNEPHGPERMPRDQPRPDPTNVTQQESLQRGASSRWLVPSGVLAAVVVALSVWGIIVTGDLLIPIIAIVFVVVMWAIMFVVSRKQDDAPRRNRSLAWLMGGMALGGLLAFLALYLVQASGIAEG